MCWWWHWPFNGSGPTRNLHSGTDGPCLTFTAQGSYSRYELPVLQRILPLLKVCASISLYLNRKTPSYFEVANVGVLRVFVIFKEQSETNQPAKQDTLACEMSTVSPSLSNFVREQQGVYMANGA